MTKLLTATVSSVGNDHTVDLTQALKVHPPPLVIAGVGGGGVGTVRDVSVLVAIHNLLWMSKGIVIGTLRRWLVQSYIC